MSVFRRPYNIHADEASTQAVFGIDLIAPKVFGAPIDLVVSGPNEGNNLGPFIYTLSGTVGATYTSIERGVRTDS